LVKCRFTSNADKFHNKWRENYENGDVDLNRIGRFVFVECDFADRWFKFGLTVLWVAPIRQMPNLRSWQLDIHCFSSGIAGITSLCQMNNSIDFQSTKVVIL